MNEQHHEREQRSAHSIHQGMQQKSQTLNRRYLRHRQPQTGHIHMATPAKVHSPAASRAVIQPIAQAAPAPSVQRPLYTPVTTPQSSAPKHMDFAPAKTAMAHPVIARAHQRLQQQHVAAPAPKAPVAHITPAVAIKPIEHARPVAKPVQHVAPVAVPPVQPQKSMKEHVIAEAVANAPKPNTREHRERGKRKNIFAGVGRKLGLASAGMGVLLLGAYFTYLNMPNLSVRVAAMQSGVASASYPSYRPSGYSLNGPVAYSSGEVRMKFVANAGPQSFSVTQTKTSWDSAALLENYVSPNSDDKYVITRQNGLTMYTFGTTTAWVNNGILYTISGDAPLSNDQIQRIALSM